MATPGPVSAADTEDGAAVEGAAEAVVVRQGDAALIDSTLPPVRFWLLSLGISSGLLLAMLDTSIIATSLFSIGQEFKSMERINWVVLSYTLSYLGCAVLLARAADVLGRRDAFLAAFGLFIAFSLGCGFAQTLEQLLVCRALQGVGGSGLYSLSMVIWPELAPNHMKQYIAALAGLVVAVGGVLGPVLGGILTHYASWRWVFWINGPIGALSVTTFYLSWPNEDQLPSIERRSWRELDYLGSLLLVAAAVLVTFAFQNVAKNTNRWNEAIFVAPIVVGICCWVLLFAWEWFIEKRGLDEEDSGAEGSGEGDESGSGDGNGDGSGDGNGVMCIGRTKTKSNRRRRPVGIMAAFPLHLLRNHVYASSLLNTMCLGFPYLMAVFALPLRLQVVNHKTSLEAGVMLLPMLAGVAIGSFAGGAFSKVKNRICETLVGGSCLMVLGLVLETTVSSSAELEPKTLGFLVFIGLGFGFSASCSTMLSSIETPIRDHAPAQGITAQLRVFGGSLGIAASSAILGVEIEGQLSGVLSPTQLASVETLGSVTLSEEQAALVRKAYSDAFRKDMIVAAVVAALGVLAAAGTYRKGRVSVMEQRQKYVEAELERRRRESERESAGLEKKIQQHQQQPRQREQELPSG